VAGWPSIRRVDSSVAATHAGTIGPGPGLVEHQRKAFEVFAVQAGDGLVGLFLVRHLEEAESEALATELVLDDRRAFSLAERCNDTLKVLNAFGNELAFRRNQSC